ncbi:MAG: c-type cytochrome [Myxococcota bacterium]
MKLTPTYLKYGPACAISLIAAVGCQPKHEHHDHETTAKTSTPASVAVGWSDFDVGPVPTLDAAMVEKGRQVFSDNCSSCHGEKGDAKGDCAPFLVPQPRDFTSGTFRFKTTPDADAPLDMDLFRTISVGLNATAMPPWRYLLSAEDRWAAVAFVKTLSPVFAKNQKLTPVELGNPPAKFTAENLANGKKVFEQAQCSKCHGDAGYGDGPSSATLTDAFDHPIPARNFHKPGDFKRGHTLREIALTVHTGNNGTPMPSFCSAFTEEDIWDLAAYIYSLADKGMRGGGRPAADSQGKHLGEPDLVVKLVERKWKFVPNLIRVKQGQLVRIDFQPTDNGLGAGHGFAIDGYDKSAFINGAMVQRPKSVTFLADKAGTFAFYCATQCSTGGLHPKMTGTLVVETAAN